MTLFTSIDNLLSLSPVRRALKNNNLLPQSAIRKCCSHFDRLIPDWIQWPLDGFGLFLLTSSRVSFWDQLDLLKTIKIKPVVSSHLHIRVAQSIRIHRNEVTGLQQLKELELKYPLLYCIESWSHPYWKKCPRLLCSNLNMYPGNIIMVLVLVSQL